MTERDKVIQTLENIASEPLFGGQSERLKQAIEMLKVDSALPGRTGVVLRQELRLEAGEWERVFYYGHTDRSNFLDLSPAQRDALHLYFRKLLQWL